MSQDDKTIKEATPEELKAELRKKCEHKRTTTRRDGILYLWGTVICLDCGYERDWNAY